MAAIYNMRRLHFKRNLKPGFSFLHGRKALLKEARHHCAFKRLREVPGLGPIRVAQVIAAIGSPLGSARSDSYGHTVALRSSRGLVPTIR
jgi:hypothetical protein